MPPQPPSICRPSLLRRSQFKHTCPITFDHAGIRSDGMVDFKPFQAEPSVSKSRSNRLANRKVMITGSSNPLTFAVAKRFLQEGATKIVWQGRDQILQETVKKLKKELSYPDAPIKLLTGAHRELDSQPWGEDTKEGAELVSLFCSQERSCPGFF